MKNSRVTQLARESVESRKTGEQKVVRGGLFRRSRVVDVTAPCLIIPVLIEHKTKVNEDGPEAIHASLVIDGDELAAYNAGEMTISDLIVAHHDELEAVLEAVITVATDNLAAAAKETPFEGVVVE